MMELLYCRNHGVREEGTGRDSLEPERARKRERERLGVGPQAQW